MVGACRTDTLELYYNDRRGNEQIVDGDVTTGAAARAASSVSSTTDGRRRRSGRSRDAIVAAAGSLFIDRGYVATTISDIAATADVAVQTVYYVFGTKPKVLAGVLDAVIAGDAAPGAIAGRSWFPTVDAGDDCDDAFAAVTDACVDLLQRVAPLYAVLRSASADPEVADLLVANRAGRRADQRTIVRDLWRAGWIRADLDLDAAADVFYGLVNEDVFGLLVDDCGWSGERFRAWLGDTLRCTLLAGDLTTGRA